MSPCCLSWNRSGATGIAPRPGACLVPTLSFLVRLSPPPRSLCSPGPHGAGRDLQGVVRVPPPSHRLCVGPDDSTDSKLRPPLPGPVGRAEGFTVTFCRFSSGICCFAGVWRWRHRCCSASPGACVVRVLISSLCLGPSSPSGQLSWGVFTFLWPFWKLAARAWLLSYVRAPPGMWWLLVSEC